MSKSDSVKKKIVVCKNCGAGYPISQLNCPYCGHENPIESARQFNEKLGRKRKEINELAKKPDKVSRHIIKTLVICIAVTIILITIVVIISMNRSDSSNKQYDTKEKELNELESMYQEGDYAAITGKVKAENLYNGAFAKYFQIADVYYYKEMSDGYISQMESDTSEYEPMIELYIESAISYGCIAINTAQTYIDANDNFDNDDVLAKLRDEVKSVFLERFKLTQEEVAQLLVIENSEDINDYAVKAYGRMYQ